MPDQAYLSANDIADLLGRHRPTEDQRAIIEAPLTSMLVIAGAGSGKTETMSARVVWLIANNMVAPSEVTLSFPAAKQVRLFDPLSGDEPAKTLGPGTSCSVRLGAFPQIVEITA